MGNKISEEKMEKVVEALLDGHSIRSAAKIGGVAKETAHRLQKEMRCYDIILLGYTEVRIGSVTFKVRDIEERWFKQQYVNKEWFEEEYERENGKKYQWR